MRGADLRLANLNGADLRSADLTGACMENARLAGARLGGAVLTGTGISMERLTRTEAEMMPCPRCGGEGWWRDERSGVTHRCHDCATRGRLPTGRTTVTRLAEWDETTVWDVA